MTSQQTDINEITHFNDTTTGIDDVTSLVEMVSQHVKHHNNWY